MHPKNIRGFWSARGCLVITVVLAGGLVVTGWEMPGWRLSMADDAVDEKAAGDAVETADDDGEGGIGFPSDRLRERQLDRARRLIDDQRWSDAATLFDEILASDRDSFFRADPQQRTWQSIKSETNRLIGDLEKPGRDAYELQFRARADRSLEQAIAANDAAGIVAVARRWFHTPAGYRATLLAAIEALETSQPLAAVAWLDRLASADGAASFEPTLSIMRAIAWLRAGDRTAAAAILDRARGGGRNVVRIAGKDVPLSFPDGGGLAWLMPLVGDPPGGRGSRGAESTGGNWVMYRGDPARNGVVDASCPLLAPRYRVPLARHPEESRLLDSQRRIRADQEIPVLPVGTPLAVDGTILVHTTMGLLAVDFETGKRIWLQSGPHSAPPQASAPGGEGGGDAADPDAGGSFSSAFEDATGGTLASDGRLVFVVESHPDAMSARQTGGINFRPGLQAAGAGFQGGGGWRGGNALSAYGIADRGSLRWRLPARGAAAEEGGLPVVATDWYLGAPLPVGEQLFVLVEEKGEIRLDVIDAATGRVDWSQPFAEVDEEWAIDNRDSHARRLSGLSPALSEGVLVCPTGAGAVVAIDLATRTLLWASEYPQPRQVGMAMLPNGIRVPRNGPIAGGFGADGGRERTVGRWLDSTPILAGGRVLLTPRESQELLCLDLRRGTTAWRLPRKDRLCVVGIVDGRAFVVGRRSVEALDMASGRVVWQRPLTADHGSPSGRGILTANRLFLPLDTPEVLEIDLADGRFVSRSSAHGTFVPGNLLAYRGEVISQAADSLDVFHQSAALESRIDTAVKSNSRDTWAMLWRGQLALDRGDIATGIAAVREAHALQPQRVPASVVATAVRFALERDFAKAAPLWREAVALSGSPAAADGALRTTVDGFLRSGDLPQAWEALRQLLTHTSSGAAVAAGSGFAAQAASAGGLIPDGADPHLAVTPTRWLHGRFAELFAKAPPSLRSELDAFAARALAAVTAANSATEGGGSADNAVAERAAQLREFVALFGAHDRGVEARRQLAALLDESIEGGVRGDDGRQLAVERDFVLLDRARVGTPADREQAASLLAGIRNAPQTGLGGTTGLMDPAGAEAWPLGKITQRRIGGIRRGGMRQGDADELRFVRSKLIQIPLAAGSDSFIPGLELAFDQQVGIIATDGFGRPVGEPFELKSRPDAGRLMPMFQHGVIDDASALGRVVFVRAGGSVAAFELASAGGTGQGAARNRLLWKLASKSTPDADARAVGFVMNVGAARGARQGNIPLGARISEPRIPGEGGRRGGTIAAAARCQGLAIMDDRTLAVYDPLTGQLLWERQRLPQASELIGDDDFLCVCPADGRGAVVLAMADGRIVRTLDLPASERRLLTSGRFILTVQPATEQAASDSAGRVEVDRLDPVDGQRLRLGDYPGESRTCAAAAGRLAIVEPSGDLSLLDIDTGTSVFRTRLPDMPAGMEQLQVMSWAGRYLVLVGRAETADEQKQLERIGAIAALPGMPGRDMPQLLTGSLWAVDAASGDMLWPVPATILRHSPQGQSGSRLPVLLFARTIQAAREPDRQRLSVLCLDKRTGQALYVDDRFNGRAALRPDMMVLGCGISGDPATHTIDLSTGRREAPDLQLEFTGQPVAPRPPFQASAMRSSATTDPLLEIEYWIKKALLIPLPF